MAQYFPTYLHLLTWFLAYCCKMISHLKILLLLVYAENILVEGHTNMPWSQASIHFNQIIDSVKENKRDIWDFEIRIIEDIKSGIHHWCRDGKIRIYHTPIDSTRENCLGISTKNYVVTHPQSPEEEKYAWTLPAVRCRTKQELEQSIMPVQSTGSVDISDRKKKVGISLLPQAREGMHESREHSESDSSSSSEEDDEYLEEKKRENDRISNIDKLLLSNRLQPFEVEDESQIVEEDLEKEIDSLRRQERERFVALEVLVVSTKGASKTDPTEVISKKADHTCLQTDRHLDAISEWKKGEGHSEKIRSEHDKGEYIIEEMDPDQINKMKSAKRDHDQTFAVARIKGIKEQKAAQRNHVDENVRESTIETMKRDKDHMSKIKDDGIREESQTQESSSSEYPRKQQPIVSDNQDKELFSAKLSRHLTFRKKIKKPSEN